MPSVQWELMPMASRRPATFFALRAARTARPDCRPLARARAPRRRTGTRVDAPARVNAPASTLPTHLKIGHMKPIRLLYGVLLEEPKAVLLRDTSH